MILNILGLLLLLAVCFVFGVILNGGMYLLADKLGWFKAKPVKKRWYDPIVDKATARYYRRNI